MSWSKAEKCKMLQWRSRVAKDWPFIQQHPGVKKCNGLNMSKVLHDKSTFPWYCCRRLKRKAVSEFVLWWEDGVVFKFLPVLSACTRQLQNERRSGFKLWQLQMSNDMPPHCDCHLGSAFGEQTAQGGGIMMEKWRRIIPLCLMVGWAYENMVLHNQTLYNMSTFFPSLQDG